MYITKIRHDWPEADGFHLIRPKGRMDYTFIHFITPVILDIDRKHIPVRAGGCIIFPPDMPQSFTAQGPLIHNWFHAAPSAQSLFTHYNLPIGQVFYPYDTLFISEHFRKMELELFSENPYKDDLSDSYLREFLIWLFRSTRDIAPPVTTQSEHAHLKEMRQRVLSNPQQKWTVSQMAELVSLSVSRFHTVYKTLFGTSPMQDLIEAKIEYAKSLLLTHGDLPLPQIAEMLGYNDQYHFIRQFRAETGITPGAYRKMNQ